VLHLKKKDKDNTKEEYIFKTNEKGEKVIKKTNKQTKQEINIIFENEEQTDIMTEIQKQLIEYYIEDILKL